MTIQLSKVESEAAVAEAVVLYLFTGPDLDRRHQRYVNNGVSIIQPPQTMPWGMREFQIVDNNGYRLRFGTPARSPHTWTILPRITPPSPADASAPDTHTHHTRSDTASADLHRQSSSWSD